jgi:DNA-binding NarL/FixJ family response regulator
VSFPSPSRLALIDHHPLFVHGLELLLPAISDGRFQVVGSTNDAASAAALVRRCLPDLALVDLQLPPPGGIRAVAAIRRAAPRLRVIAMSGPEEPTLAVAALRAGAEGCMPKGSQAEDWTRRNGGCCDSSPRATTPSTSPISCTCPNAPSSGSPPPCCASYG